MKWQLIAILNLAGAAAMAVAQADNPDMQRLIDEARRRVEAEHRIIVNTLGGNGEAITMTGAGGLVAPGKREKVPYVGISTAPVSAALAEQLSLSTGMGLVVDYVEPGSPAQTAGVARYDVLTRLDDQRLANSEQFRALLRLRGKGQPVKLGVIRHSKPQEITVTLGEKDQDVLVSDTIRHTQVRAVRPGAPLADAAVAHAIVGPVKGAQVIVTTEVNGQSSAVWSDDAMKLTMTLKDSKAASLVAEDLQSGKKLFDGPVETAEQRKALPPDVATKLSEAESAMTPPPGAMPQVMPLGGRAWGARGGGGALVGGGGLIVGGAAAGAESRVLVSSNQDLLLLARFERGKPVYALAFSTNSGKTLFDGPVATDEQRKSLPQAVAAQLDVVAKNQHAATEFGVMGR